MTEIVLQEWQEAGPRSHPSVLRGLVLPEQRAVHEVVNLLNDRGCIELTETRDGLQVHTTSWIGSITIGELRITILPKIENAPFLNLLRYAYSLRNLDILGLTQFSTQYWSFSDLLVHQLISECTEVVARGLHRTYIHRHENLASPRGHIDFHRAMHHVAVGLTTVPCLHHPRSADNALNRVILAGLLHAARITADIELRSRIRRLTGVLSDEAERVRLDWKLVDGARNAIDRRTSVYEPAISIIELLMESEGIALEIAERHVRVPGFLFDLNRFFQELVGKFLRENLEGCVIRSEHQLREVFSYDHHQNPRQRRSPTPRPDFAVFRDGTLVAFLDAKYRDLWDKALPRDMLYQLAVYALSRGGKKESIILYPTLDPHAVDQRILIHAPSGSDGHGAIILRPVQLLTLQAVLGSNTGFFVSEKRRELARGYVFGIGRESLPC